MTVIDCISKAMTLSDAMEGEPHRIRGKGLLALRREVDAMQRPDQTNPDAIRKTRAKARWFFDYVNAIDPSQSDVLPILHDDMRTLIDALCFKKGFPNRASAWGSIGISGDTGSGWTNPNTTGCMRWPSFATLRAAVMEDK